MKIKPQRKHWWVGLGGTFDHFHAGHEHFLTFAAKQGENLLIGITDSQVTQGKSNAHIIEPFRTRARNVSNWCKKHEIQHEIVHLYDVYGPTLEDKRIQALAVTEETVAGADTINQARSVSRMRELPVYICPMFKNDQGQALHADQIRAGVTSRTGTVYLNHFKKGITLNAAQKEELSKPLGTIITSPDSKIDTSETNPHMHIVVGDHTTLSFLSAHKKFDVAVVDGFIERAKISVEQQEQMNAFVSQYKPDVVNITNPAGTLSEQLVAELQSYAQTLLKNTGNRGKQNAYKLFKIEGEEDLVTAALILCMPLDTRLYYGQPQHGLVEVIITEQLKEKIFKILSS